MVCGPLLGAIAAGATFDRPDDLTFDRDGNLFVADSFDERIRRIDTASRIITTVAGNGSAGNVRPPDGILAVEAALFSPGSPAVDHDGNLYFVDLNDFWRVDTEAAARPNLRQSSVTASIPAPLLEESDFPSLSTNHLPRRSRMQRPRLD